MEGGTEETVRLLVTLPDGPELRAAVGRILPPAEIAFGRPPAGTAWPKAEAWLVGVVPREWPDWGPSLTPRLRFVQRVFTGLDDFPFDRFPPDVTIAGNVGAYAPFVAEHAVALLLALGHNVVPNWEKVRAGRLRPPVANRYLPGRSVLLLGYGEIGRAIADRLRPFGVRLEGVSRSGAPSRELERMYPATALREALASADIAIDCRPLTSATRDSIGRAELAAMRPSAIYLNVGRAGTVQEAALYEHLASHPDFRAGLDVWWNEDFESGTLRTLYPFHELTNFLGSPHVAGVGSAAYAHALAKAVENLGRFFAGATPLHRADRAEYSRRA